MSEPAFKRHPIDLEEFDRRLRGEPAPQAELDDPLAELARLVSNSPDPFASVLPRGRSGASRPPQPPLRGQADPRQAEVQAEEEWPEEAAPPPRSERPLAPPYAERLAPRRPARPRAPIVLMSGALALVVAGIAGTLAFHGRRAASPPTILADTTPYKIKAPQQARKDKVEDATTLLDKQVGDSIRPAHIVNTEEQPVDLSAVTPPAPASLGDDSAFPAPRRVKTVSVRPDGSIIEPNGQPDEPAPAASESAGASRPTGSGAPPPAPAAAQAVPAPAVPPPAAPPPAEPVRPPVRQAATSFASVIDQATTPAPPAAKPASPPAPKPPERAATPAPAAPVRTADLGQDRAAAPTGESWAVQLAAPGTARDAHVEMLRLERKFARQLGGKSLITREAQSNGRTVFRVRAAGLSRENALSLCSRIKSAGGACFVAHE